MRPSRAFESRSQDSSTHTVILNLLEDQPLLSAGRCIKKQSLPIVGSTVFRSQQRESGCLFALPQQRPDAGSRGGPKPFECCLPLA